MTMVMATVTKTMKKVPTKRQKVVSDNNGQTKGVTRHRRLLSTFLVTVDSNLDEFAHHLAFLMAPHDLSDYVIPGRSKHNYHDKAATNKALTSNVASGSVVDESEDAVNILDNNEKTDTVETKTSKTDTNDKHRKKTVCKRRRVTFEDRINGCYVNSALPRKQQQQQCTKTDNQGTLDTTTTIAPPPPPPPPHRSSGIGNGDGKGGDDGGGGRGSDGCGCSGGDSGGSRGGGSGGSNGGGEDKMKEVAGNGDDTVTDHPCHLKVHSPGRDEKLWAEKKTKRELGEGGTQRRRRRRRRARRRCKLTASDRSSDVVYKTESIFKPSLILTAKRTDVKKTKTTTPIANTTTAQALTKVVAKVVAMQGRNNRIRYYPQVRQFLFQHKKILSTRNVFVYNTPLMYRSLSSNEDEQKETRESYFFGTALDTGKRLVHVAYLDYEHRTSGIFCNDRRRRFGRCRPSDSSGEECSKPNYSPDYYDTSSEEDEDDNDNEISGGSDGDERVGDVGDKRETNIESHSARFDNYVSRNRIQTFTCNSTQLHQSAIVVLFLNNVSFTNAITAFGSVCTLDYCVLLSSNNLGVDALSLIVSDMLRKLLQHDGKLWNIFSNREYTCACNKFIVLNPYAYMEKIRDTR